MFTSFSDAKEYITKEEVGVLDLKYIDFNGRWGGRLPQCQFRTGRENFPSSGSSAKRLGELSL